MWNSFDFIVALGSILNLIITKNSDLDIKGTTILRAFRILRLLRLLKRGGKNLYMIFNTFVITIKSLANMGALLLLIMYMYSIVGMIILGEYKRVGAMNDYINFESFSSAIITLFTVATGDSWDGTTASFIIGQEAWNDCKINPTY